MKAWWTAQSVRIDALGLRERVFLFLAILVCLMALADTLWLSPAQTEHTQLTQRFNKQNAELQKLRDELRAMPKLVDPNLALRAELGQVKIRLDGLDAEIKTLTAPATGDTPLTQVLVHFLRRYDKLTLVRTATLPSLAFAAAPLQGVGPVASGVSRQGIELTVAGPYPELIRMVQTLEKAIPALRWGDMKMAAETLPPQLTLQVFVIGVQP